MPHPQRFLVRRYLLHPLIIHCPCWFSIILSSPSCILWISGLLAMLFEPQKQLHWSLILFGLQYHIGPSFGRLTHSFLAQTTTFS